MMKRESISYTDAVKRLLNDVPEISDLYNHEQVKWGIGSIPAHIAYGSLFAGFLRHVVAKDTLGTGSAKSDIIRRSFQLIEDLVQSSDFQTRCIAEVSILESLLGQEKDDWQQFASYFGKSTFDMALEVAQKMGITVTP